MTMKKWICMMLVCVFMVGYSLAEGLLPELDDVYGVGMPSLYSILERYPDSYEEIKGGVEETWENLSDAEFTAYGDYLATCACEMLSYTSENGVFEAEVGKNGRSYRFIYDGNTKQATLFFPTGTYDDALYYTEQSYQKAKTFMDIGEYTKAITLLLDIRGYRDVDIILGNDENIVKSSWSVPGSIVTFGAYEQDNDITNGTETIEWIVLKNNDKNSILISRYGLDCKSYNDEKADVTWETCTLRKWLNDDFYNKAFSQDEQTLIEKVTVAADINLMYNSNSGNDTNDKVYLLSANEADILFPTEVARQCQATNYARANGANVNTNYSIWWLRSPGLSNEEATHVLYNGCIRYYGYDVDCKSYVVRPVISVRLVAPPTAENVTDEIIEESNNSFLPLKKGAKGDAVMELQRTLIEAGALSGKPDGDYGRMTEEAVKQMQTEYGMEATGIADEEFQEKLYGN